MERKDSTAGKRSRRVVSWLDEGDAEARDEPAARFGRHAADPPSTQPSSAWTFTGASGGRPGRHAAEVDPEPAPSFPPLVTEPVRPVGGLPDPQWWESVPDAAAVLATRPVSVVRIALTVFVLAAIVLLALVVAAVL
jgi:hypothetical protein